MIIVLFLSRSLTRLLATAAVLALGLVGLAIAEADAAPDAGWVQLAVLPEKLDAPVFALAVDPANAQLVLAGTASGSIYRSADGGATWALVKRDLGRGVLTLTFNPFKPGQALAGTRAGGVWRSTDSGQTWAVQPGAEKSTARSFAFARSLAAAGTDRGVLTSRQEGPWTPAGLDQVSVGALALAVVGDPARILAGGDATRGQEVLPLFQSTDGAATWLPLAGPASGSSMVAALVAGPLGPKQDVRPLLLGTNAGVFVSIDNGASWQQLSGGGALPNTDYGQLAFAGARTDRFYVASDGGASDRGGLWTTVTGGQQFTSLNPPVASVTALSVSSEGDVPVVYAATFRAADHGVAVWRLRDTGQAVPAAGEALPPVAASPAAGPGAAAAPAPAVSSRAIVSAVAVELITGPEAPFLALGLVALGVILVAAVAHLRRGRA